MTRKLAILHDKGFVFDFSILPDNVLYCLQTKAVFCGRGSVISLDDQFYDSLTPKYQYQYTVETDSGERGVMMIPGICFSLKQIAS